MTCLDLSSCHLQLCSLTVGRHHCPPRHLRVSLDPVSRLCFLLRTRLLTPRHLLPGPTPWPPLASLSLFQARLSGAARIACLRLKSDHAVPFLESPGRFSFTLEEGTSPQLLAWLPLESYRPSCVARPLAPPRVPHTPLSRVSWRCCDLFHVIWVPARHSTSARMSFSLRRHLRQNKFSLLPSAVLGTYFAVACVLWELMLVNQEGRTAGSEGLGGNGTSQSQTWLRANSM